MTTLSDAELDHWMADWSAAGDEEEPTIVNAATPARRSRMVMRLPVLDWVIGTGALGFLAWAGVTAQDPIDRVVMGMLGLVVATSLAFGYWNWQGTWRASAEATGTFVALWLERCLRLQRAIRAGWCLLAAEAIVFTPWVAYRVSEASERGSSPLWPWVLLGGMLLLGMLHLRRMEAWARRETAAVATLQRELGEE